MSTSGHLILTCYLSTRFHHFVDRETMSQSTAFCRVVCGDVPRFSRVELPCFVQETETAFESMGGKDIVSEAIKDSDTSESSIQFRYPSTSMSFKSLPASIVQKRGLLLRIRRKKNMSGATGDGVTCQIIGSVDKTLSFNSLADYEVDEKFCLWFLVCTNIKFIISVHTHTIFGVRHNDMQCF